MYFAGEMGSPERKSSQSEYEKALDSLSSLITRRIRADGTDKGYQFELMVEYLKVVDCSFFTSHFSLFVVELVL